MMDLQNQYDNYTTFPHREGTVCRVYLHVRECCAIVISVNYRNQTSTKKRYAFRGVILTLLVHYNGTIPRHIGVGSNV
jgi:hypothetical protein